MVGQHVWDELTGDIRYLIDNISLFDPSLELSDKQLQDLASSTAGAYEEGVKIVYTAKAIANTVKSIKTNQLIKAGNQIDKGGELTKAGRSLQKHGSRPNSQYPKPTGSISDKNALGNQVLQSILNDPKATHITRHHARFGDVLEIISSNGMGARFSANGKTFIGFLES